MDEAVRQRKEARLAREQQIADMYRQNQTLEKIGAHFGLTRQRVQPNRSTVN